MTQTSGGDRTPVKNGMRRFCTGVVLADSGYVSSKLKSQLEKQGCFGLAWPKENQERPFADWEKKVDRFRVTIERVFSLLKRCFHWVDFNPRHYQTFLVNPYAAFAAYSLKQKGWA